MQNSAGGKSGGWDLELEVELELETPKSKQEDQVDLRHDNACLIQPSTSQAKMAGP